MKKKTVLRIGLFCLLVALGVYLAVEIISAQIQGRLPFSSTASKAGVSSFADLPGVDDDRSWWQEARFYEIFVRSFYDSDGDGIGDLQGIIEKLDYLNDGDPQSTHDLGITAIWLMPIHPSPSYHGYDVTDYYAIHPDYGTLEDFQELLEEAHRRGIRVIIDLVLNHTAVQHPWFQQARDPDSPYRDWYLWSDMRLGVAWHPSDVGYYYGHFWAGMPDLNYANPEVTAEMLNVARFWLEQVGVDGFRLDAIKHLIEEEGKAENTQATHAWLKGFARACRQSNPRALLVGEIWDSSILVAEYTVEDELDMAFSFDLAQGFVSAAEQGKAIQVTYPLVHDLQRFAPGSFASFLRNHDQVRLMTQLGGDIDKAKVAASLLLLSPGTPFLYYGEEIGMLGTKPDERIRTPMQWSDQPQAGFTTGVPWQALGIDHPDHTVAAQQADPDSLWHWYRGLLETRGQYPALQFGATYLLQASDPSVYAILRATKEELVMAIVNLSERPIEGLRLSLAEGPLSPVSYRAQSVWGQVALPPLQANKQGGFEAYSPFPILQPYETWVIALQP